MTTTQEQPTAAPILEAISQSSVPDGRPWMAVNAQVMADMLRLDEALVLTGEKLDPGIYEFRLTPSPPLENSRFVQEAHRNNVLDFVPEKTASVLQDIWAPLDHLALVRSPTAGDMDDAMNERLLGRRSKDRRDELATYAANAHTMSAAMLEAGMIQEAFRIAYRADLATFEVHCFDLASNYGDVKLATIDVRMEVAKVTLRTIQPSGDFGKMRNAVRGALVWSSMSPEPIPWLS